MPRIDMEYIIKPRAALTSVYDIERKLLRRPPIVKRWAKYHMANTEKWYYAYMIVGDIIVVMDACLAQNMHEE